MLKGVSARIGIVLAGFFCLVVGSVFVTLRAIETQAKDALIINLAGRQRMLIEGMTGVALSPVFRGKGAAQATHSAEAFDSTLKALLHGGSVPYGGDARQAGTRVILPLTEDPEIRSRLLSIQALWQRFRSLLEEAMNAPPGSRAQADAAEGVSRISPGLLGQMDGVVRLFQNWSERKLGRLRQIQMALLGAGLLMLAGGFLLSHRMIVRPLQLLEGAARRIGRGNLAEGVPVSGPGEVGVLGETLDAMRVQLNASREALLLSHQNLEERVARRTQELAALHQVSNEITSRLQVEEVLNSVVEKARQLLRAEVAALCFCDESGSLMKVQAFSGPEGVITQRVVSVQKESGGVAPAVMSTGHAMACGDERCQEGCGAIDPEYQRSHLVAPLRIGGEMIGALCVGHRDPNMNWKDSVTLLDRLAASASIALENARLHRQAERLAALEERQRVAADVHDGLAQSLSALNHRLERTAELISRGEADNALLELEQAHRAMENSAGHVRELIADLRNGGGQSTLQDLLWKIRERFSREGGPAFQMSIEEDSAILLDPALAAGVERILWEALTNVRKHARTPEVQVSLKRESGRVQCTVSDRGSGFDPQAQREGGTLHFGLQIMQARAARIGAHLDVHSRPGEGTMVVLSWPEAREVSVAGEPSR
ncbi:MAG: GAF domain-containing protein [Candidatus Tectomicrobia bacterium]|uniref:histidine kinase n=1 Tax=Tectimicrobiota bacterium TaxID=2528274 RepID=A0A932M2D5_UNCTE|nr:GAF domain-containing protein [Candidatus Tectomicrobia bacterium]